MTTGKSSRLARAAWGVLGANVLVILWGAFVRATGSGAGCGDHWPECNGEVIPKAPTAAMLIEYSHRLSSGFAFLLVVGLTLLAFRDRGKGHPARAATFVALSCMLGEVLIGAGLVLLKLVAADASLLRGVAIELHAGNTFVLLAALALTAHFADLQAGAGGHALRPTRPAVYALLGLAATFASGAIAALGDTLFPARTFAAGLEADLSAQAHLFLHLRTLHPLFAVLASALVVHAANLVRRAHPDDAGLARLAWVVAGAAGAQIAVGIVNLALLAPVPTQILHLGCADALFVAFVLMSARALTGQRPRSDTSTRRSVAQSDSESPAPSSPADAVSTRPASTP